MTISNDDDQKGNFDIQEYTCQISAYTPTDLKHSVKIRGEYDKNDNNDDDDDDEIKIKMIIK